MESNAGQASFVPSSHNESTTNCNTDSPAASYPSLQKWFKVKVSMHFAYCILRGLIHCTKMGKWSIGGIEGTSSSTYDFHQKTNSRPHLQTYRKNQPLASGLWNRVAVLWNHPPCLTVHKWSHVAKCLEVKKVENGRTEPKFSDFS